jgi:type IV secretory pathway TraG/TraD family ATPase VirD4
MAVTNTILYGNSVSKNLPPSEIDNTKVNLKGTFNGQKASFGINEDILSKHMLLVGGTGCGKTTLFYHFVNQIKKSMTSEDVMIIFDSKGDFYSKFYAKGDSVIGNSPQYRDISASWNVFKEILADGWDDREIIINSQEIAKSLFQERLKNNSQPFFPNAARDLLAALLISTIRFGKENSTIVQKYFYNSEFKLFLDELNYEEIQAALEKHVDLSGVLSYVAGESGQSQGVLSELFSIVREIFIGVFAQEGKFSMRNFVRAKGGKTLFIEYDLAIGSMLTPVYRLLFDLALKEALGRTKSQGNVYLICDEFKLLPHLQHIDDGVNFGRSLGVKVMAGIQSIEQLFETYGPSRGKNIAAGFSSIFAFRANDVSTRDYISGLFGKNIILEQYKLLNNTIVEEKRQGSTVEDWDMNSLRVGEAIVGLPFSQPFKFYFDMYK